MMEGQHFPCVSPAQETSIMTSVATVTINVGVILVGYESLTTKLVKLLERLKNREVSPDYTYYGIASPWLQVCIITDLRIVGITRIR